MRKTRTFVLAALVGGMLALPAISDAQGRAVPRGGGGGGGGGGAGGGHPSGQPVPRPPIASGGPGHAVARPPGNYPNNGQGNYYGHGHAYYGGYYGYPWYGGYYGYGYGYPYGFSVGFGFGYPAYGGYYGYPAYGYPAYVQSYGGVRISVPQRDAEVFVDGYYAGVVDQYDGTFQQVNLVPGTHRIEVRAPGFDSAVFDVNVQPGQTISYRAPLR
jgi:hypothetical protein